MADPVQSLQSRREAVQPSLWDRLVDDLPGLAAETDRRQAELSQELGEERLQRLIDGGRRAIEQDAALDDKKREEVSLFLARLERRRFLEERRIVVTGDVLREAVRRGIQALFNTERHESWLITTDAERQRVERPGDIIAEFPHVRRSVVNFGVPAFSGRRAVDFDPDKLSREITEVVATFEPRFKRDTIRVTVDASQATGLRVTVEGTLMLSPVPERMRLSTTIDLDRGSASTVIEDD